MTDEDKAAEAWVSANEKIIVEAGLELWAAIDTVLKEELRDQPKIYRRILRRLMPKLEAKAK